MFVWKIHTNEHPNGILVRNRFSEKQIRLRMTAYIRAKRKEGIPLKDIIYCWGKVYPQNHLP